MSTVILYKMKLLMRYINNSIFPSIFIIYRARLSNRHKTIIRLQIFHIEIRGSFRLFALFTYYINILHTYSCILIIAVSFSASVRLKDVAAVYIHQEKRIYDRAESVCRFRNKGDVEARAHPPPVSDGGETDRKESW